MGALRSLSWAHRLAVVVCLAVCDLAFAANHSVTMNDSHSFSRPSLTITAGDSVTWTSLTSVTPHNVTCSSAPAGCFAASPTLLVFPGFSSSFKVTFVTPGSHAYRCTFHAGMNGTVTVNTGPLHHFNVTAVASTTAGNSFDVTVEAKDSVNNRVTGYTGTVHFTSSDGAATLPADSTLVNGIKTFTGVILRTAGTRSITVNDTVSTTITGTRNVTVNPAAASQLVITAPANATATGAFQVVVTARDQFNNTATGYTGTVHFTSSDPAAVVPPDSPLFSGTRNFNVTLATTGPQVITVTDTLSPTITGSTTVNVAIDCSISFSNAGAISVPLSGNASPYPSTIVVGGLKQTINGMSVTLNGLTHAQPADIDVLLVGPAGQKMIIMSDAGSTFDVSNISITFSDSGVAFLPVTDPLTGGIFKPTNQAGTDTFPSTPAGTVFSPGPNDTATFASVFNGTDPNGTWRLFVVDDLASPSSTGNFAGGWTLTFAAPPNTYCNKTNIAIPREGNATPYPSSINVSGVDGTIKNATVRLNGLSQFSTGDLDLLLVGPGDRKMTILSDVNTTMATNAVVSFDDSGVAIPATVTSGIFQPRNVSQDADSFSTPAPPPPYSDPPPTGSATFASVFNGADPNGNWDLFVVDDTPTLIGLPGSILQGWTLTLDVIFNTSTTLTSTVNPSFAGDLINFRANVTSSGPIPAGTVTFKDGDTVLATELLLEGNTAIDFAFVPGVHNITATYNGGANFHPSTSETLTQTVIPAPTTVTVVSSLNPSTFGQPVTFTATVAEVSFSVFSPTGTVTFLDGTSVLGTGLVNASGAATLTTTAVGGGSRSITAVYEGDSNFAPGTSAELTQAVNGAATSTTLLSSPNPSTLGSSVTFTATVSGGALGVPRGTITFKDGTTSIGNSTVNESGVGTFSTSDLSVGTHNITAVYNGSDDFATSTSAPQAQTVDKATPTANLISFQNPSDFGQEVTFRADVTSSASTPPTGSVIFKEGLTVLGTVTLNGSGTVLFSTSALVAGMHDITAAYDGDANFNGNISAPVTQVVNTSTATFSFIGPEKLFFRFRDPIAFQVQVVSTTGGTVTGTVTVLEGDTALGTATLDGDGRATVLVNGLRPGEHQIRAVYNGDPNFPEGAESQVIVYSESPRPR